jgi:hypothetical protein
MKFAVRCLLFLCLFAAHSSLAQDILIAVKKDGKWGYVNTSGASVIAGRFEEAYPFYSGKAVAVEKKQYGLIDTRGAWLVPPRKGTALGEINSNRVVCSNELGKWGEIDTKGSTKVEFEKDIMSAFQTGWALAGSKTSTPGLYRVAVIDTLGKVVVNFDNTYLTEKSIIDGKRVREGYVSVLVDVAAGDLATALLPSTEKVDGKTLYYALLDVKNKRLVSLKIPSLEAEVREGRFNMSVEGIAYSWSQPLPAEPVVSEAKFSFLSPVIFPFSGGVAAVQKEGKWAFVDKDGSLLSESNLTAEEYSNEKPLYTGGFVMLWKKGGSGIYVDLNGHQRIPLEFEELHPFQSGAAVVKYKGKYGLIQKDGTWALPAEFEGIRF